MKRKKLFGGILISSLIILASLTSVVGVQTLKTESKNGSPLFSNRLTKMINKDDEEIKSNYIRKGTTVNLFSNKKSYARVWMDKAINVIQTNPAIVDRIFARIDKMPYVMSLLKENGLCKKDITKYTTQIKNNPSLLKQEIDLLQFDVDGAQSPTPRGLSTSSAIGCFITAMVLFPVVVLVAVIIGTITILTCLNYNDCLENLMRSIWDNILQDLIPA
jgi:hypothetical protein